MPVVQYRDQPSGCAAISKRHLYTLFFTLACVGFLPSAIFAQLRLLRHQKVEKCGTVAVFFQGFEHRLLGLVIAQPIQWPARLNLQTSIQGLGVFGMPCSAYFVRISLPARVIRKTYN